MHCPHCGSEVKIGWKFCIKCAKPLPDENGIISETLAVSTEPTESKPKSSQAGAVIAGAIIIVIILFFLAGGNSGIFQRHTVTMEKYQRIQHGMSFSQVCQIIGEQGREGASSHMPAISGFTPSITIKMYSWQNSDGSNMNAMFENDRLINKAQFGLK